ncbi:helix-turn-helix domain-containing protein [Saccharothrix coeruleofusca]|nr:helix-turn-helix domain-containing protein [Saccharothrix coeruleofusca]
MTRFREFVAAEYAQGRTIRALAALTGRSYGTVRSALVAEGVALRSRGLRAREAAGDPQREELAVLLLSLRLSAGLTGREAGERAGMSQSKVSKLETGRLAPKPEDVARLADAYRVPPDVRGRMTALAAEALARKRRRPVLLRTRACHSPRVARAEQAATAVRVLSLGRLPDLEAYRGRLSLLVPERAAWPGLPPGTGVIPCAVPLPDTGFRVLDDRVVVVELLSGDVVLTDPDDVRAHVERFEELRARAQVSR